MTADLEGSYHAAGTVDRLLDGLRAAGVDVEALTPDDLSAVDEFHVLGVGATRAIGRAVHAAAGMSILDVGCGIGGPARRLAFEFGTRVHGVDLTAAYVEAAVELTRRCGLADRVTFATGDATSLPPSDHDAAVMFHVNMNIAAKTDLFASVRSAIEGSGRFGVWEIVRGPGTEPVYPMPWATDPVLSHLVTAADLADAAVDAGFTVERWDDRTEAGVAFFDRIRRDGPAPGPNLGLLIPDFGARVANLAAGLRDGAVALVQGVLVA